MKCMQADACILFLVVAVECGIVGDPTTVCRRTDAETWDLVTIPLTYRFILYNSYQGFENPGVGGWEKNSTKSKPKNGYKS